MSDIRATIRNVRATDASATNEAGQPGPPVSDPPPGLADDEATAAHSKVVPVGDASMSSAAAAVTDVSSVAAATTAAAISIDPTSAVQLDQASKNVIIAGLVLGMFLAALDQSVVGTAMPHITAELGNEDMLSWVGPCPPAKID